MNNFTTSLFLLSLFIAVPTVSMAGTGHDHGHSHAAISGTEAQIKAKQQVKQLVDAKKIDASWSDVKASKVKQKDYGHGPEWVIIFKNDKVKDASKQTLYLFYSQDGHYLAANYDGS